MYKTTDTRLASFLIINGFDLYDMDRVDEKKIAFIFQDESKLQTVVDIWNNGAPVGNILKYEIAKKELLNKIYAKK